jgi:phage regulator Rha-like protein
MKEGRTELLPDEALISKIYFIRGQKVMLDRDLAELYGVETKQLKRQVNRNIDRFPGDFMFELDKEEASRCQFGTLNKRRETIDSSRLQNETLKQGYNLKYLPYAFTEQGVAMLSSVLKSKQAIAVNIQIMRVFTKMREIISANKEIMHKLEQLEKRMDGKDQEIQNIFTVLRQLVEQPQPEPEQTPREQIGYKTK